MTARNGARPHVFIAHPFGGNEAVEGLIRWSYFLSASEPDYSQVFPPYGFGFLGTTDPRDAEAHVAKRAAGCSGVVLVGAGVTREMSFAVDVVHRAGGWIANMTSLGASAPPAPMPGCLERFRWQRSEDPGAGLVAFETPALVLSDRAASKRRNTDVLSWLLEDCARLRKGRH